MHWDLWVVCVERWDIPHHATDHAKNQKHLYCLLEDLLAFQGTGTWHRLLWNVQPPQFAVSKFCSRRLQPRIKGPQETSGQTWDSAENRQYSQKTEEDLYYFVLRGGAAQPACSSAAAAAAALTLEPHYHWESLLGLRRREPSNSSVPRHPLQHSCTVGWSLQTPEFIIIIYCCRPWISDNPTKE